MPSITIVVEVEKSNSKCHNLKKIVESSDANETEDFLFKRQKMDF